MSAPAGGGIRVSWQGHATTVLDVDGVRFVTDPALTARLAHLRRHSAPDLDLLRDADVVLISHAHSDHLHLPSLHLLPSGIDVIVPAGVGHLLWRQGFRHVHETQVGDRIDFRGVAVRTVPANHSRRRGPHSTVSGPAVGYLLSGRSGSVYFAGDTDLFDEMASLGPVDLALLPIGGWGSSLGPGHLDPARAVTAVRRLRPGVVVPVHWGTYSPLAMRRGEPAWLDRPATQYAALMAAAGLSQHLRTLRPGDSLVVTVQRRSVR